jgi:hypothetical protein
LHYSTIGARPVRSRHASCIASVLARHKEGWCCSLRSHHVLCCPVRGGSVPQKSPASLRSRWKPPLRSARLALTFANRAHTPIAETASGTQKRTSSTESHARVGLSARNHRFQIHVERRHKGTLGGALQLVLKLPRTFCAVRRSFPAKDCHFRNSGGDVPPSGVSRQPGQAEIHMLSVPLQAAESGQYR